MWLDNTPEDWGFREENRTAAVRGAALPWASTGSRITAAGWCWWATRVAW